MNVALGIFFLILRLMDLQNDDLLQSQYV